MSKSLLLRYLPDQPGDEPMLQWQKHPADAPHTGSLSTLAESIDPATSLTLLLPGERVIALQVEVPGANARQLRQAAPFAAEEQLTQPAESLHFCIAPVSPGQPVALLAVERAWLEGICDAFKQQGLRLERALPDWQALAPGEVVLLNSEQRVLAHSEAWRGFSAEAELAGMLLEQPLPEPISDQQLFAHCQARPGGQDAANLLHGDFAPSQSVGVNRLWLAVAGLASLLLVTHLVLTVADVWRLQSYSDQLRERQAELLGEAFPEVGRVSSDPYGQMSALVQQLRAERGEHGAGQWFAYVTPVAEVLAEDDDARVRRIQYRRDTLELEVSTSGITQLDALRERLAERHAGLAVEIASVNQDGDRANGRLLITRRAT